MSAAPRGKARQVRDAHLGTLVAALVVLALLSTLPDRCVAQTAFTVLGSGGISGQGLYSTLAADYARSQNTAQVQYTPTDSLSGLRCYFALGECDFAHIDYPLDAVTQSLLSNGTLEAVYGGYNSTTLLSADGNQASLVGATILQLPVAIVPYVMAYRLDGLTKPLVLTGALVARMWMGNVTHWNDPALVALNPQLASVGANLSITLHYTDSSFGLTPLWGNMMATLYEPFAQWSTALADQEKIGGIPAPPYGPDRAPAWCAPAAAAKRAQAWPRPSATLAAVGASSGSLTFTPLQSAVTAQLNYANMVNVAGKTVVASSTTVSGVTADFAAQISASPVDSMYAVSLVGGNGTATWPLCAFSLVVLSTNVTANNCYYVGFATNFVAYGLTMQQAVADVEALGLYTVPPRFARNVIDLMGLVQCNGQRAFTSTVLVGSGTPMPAYSMWAFSYENDNVTVDYIITASKLGKQQIIAGDVDFGTTNNAVGITGSDLGLVPVCAYPVVFCYNVPEIDGDPQPLVLDLRTAMAILLANITYWNDPALKALNPHLALPAQPIVFVGKSGASVFTGTLGAAFAHIDPSFPTVYGSGDSIAWPVMRTTRYIASNLSDQVLTFKATPYSITYTSHYTALQDRNLREASMLNAQGTAVLAPSMETTLAALAEVAGTQAGGLASLELLTYLVGTKGEHSWPMGNLCLMAIHMTQMPDAYKASQLLQWIYWTQTSTQGQQIAGATGVYGIPGVPDVWSQVLAILVNVTVDGVYVNPLRPCFRNGTLCSNRGTCDQTKGACSCDANRTGTWCESVVTSSTQGGSSNSDSIIYAAVLAPVLATLAIACCLGVVVIVALAIVKRWREGPREWEIDYDEIEMSEDVLGSGGYGEVRKAKWRGTEVAVKTMHSKEADAQRTFRDEVKVMDALRHPNVVLFMAASTKPPHLAIVMEYMALGSLYHLLHNELIPDLPMMLRYKIIYQAARGMHFLHSSGIVHRDLKSLNLLLDTKWDVKVSDFGLTKFKDDAAKKRGDGPGGVVAGSVQWVAPEVLAGADGVDYMLADVYSFGVVLWEVFTRETPYDGMSPAAVAVAVLRDGYRMPIPDTMVSPGIAKLIGDCWNADPMARPVFKDIVDMFGPVISPNDRGTGTMGDGTMSSSGAAAQSSPSSSPSSSSSIRQRFISGTNRYRSHDIISGTHRDAGDDYRSWTLPDDTLTSPSSAQSSLRDCDASATYPDARPNGRCLPSFLRSRKSTTAGDDYGDDEPLSPPICADPTAARQTPAFAISDIVDAAALWESTTREGNGAAMCEAMLTHNGILRLHAERFGGFELVGTNTNAGLGTDGTLCFAFASVEMACAWSSAVQDALARTDWPDAMKRAAALTAPARSSPDRCIDGGGGDIGQGKCGAQQQTRYEGICVRMAVHLVGATQFDSVPGYTERPAAHGPAVDHGCWLATMASAGQVLVSHAAYGELHRASAGRANADLVRLCPVPSDAPPDGCDGDNAGTHDGSNGSRDKHQGRYIHRLAPLLAKDGNADGRQDARENKDKQAADPDTDDSDDDETGSRTVLCDAATASVLGGSRPKGAGLASADTCKWVINPRDITDKQLVGVGSSGMVFAARWKDATVAVKDYNMRHSDERTRLEFRAEAGALATLSHPNVVKFIGACFDTMAIVTEYVPMGSMRAVLDAASRHQTSLSQHDRLTMLTTAARGIAYLHSLEPMIIHRDIKSSNLLVGEDFDVKVADFGFARVKQTNATMTRCGTPCWTAPEVLKGERYDEKADVYSFGIVMWETLTGARPYADKNFATVLNDIIEGVRPQVPRDCPPRLARLMSLCWDEDPSERPHMNEVVRALEDMVGKDAGAPRPKNHGNGSNEDDDFEGGL